MELKELLLQSVAVVKGKRHENYKRTVEYAEKCKTLVTAEDIEPLLERFTKRESEEDFEQRVALTKLTTNAVLSRIQKPFNKALRNDEVMIEYKEVSEKKDIFNNFFDSQSIADWLKENYVTQLFTDPNAWLLIDFKPFDSNTETADPYPLIIKSEAALDFGYDFKGLHYLTASVDDKICTYGKQYLQTLTQTPEGTDADIEEEDLIKALVLTEDEFPFDGATVEINGGVYRIGYAYHGSEKVQARRFGYKKDAYTDNKTFVTPFHDCISRLEGAIKSMSERDLTTALHTFPQKLTRSVACPGEYIDGERQMCIDGQVNTPEGLRQCGRCGGVGRVPVQTSSQETLVIPLGEDNEDRIPLEEMVKYITPDLEVAKYLTEFIDNVATECVNDIFNSNVFSIKGQKTATEVQVSYEDVYDALFPFTQGFSRTFEFCAYTVATFLDEEDFTVSHRFPTDLKLKNYNDLLTEYTASEKAPPSVREELERQLIDKKYIDNPEERKKYRLQLKFDPLAGYSAEELVLASAHIGDREQFIHFNTKKIWSEVEARNPNVYDMNERAALDLFKTIVDEMRPSLPEISIEGGTEELNAEQANKLRETVGGINGIIEMNRAVHDGTMTESAAETMLMNLFGFDVDTAKKLIDTKPKPTVEE